MVMNPFAKSNQEQVQQDPAYVQVMLSYLREDKSGTIRGTKVNNGVTEFGTRVFAVRERGGYYSLPGRVEQAQDLKFILGDGTIQDMSTLLVGQTLNIRLTEEEFEDFVEEADLCEIGIGINLTVMIPTGFVSSKDLTYKTGEVVASYTVVGELTDNGVEECRGTLVSDKLTKEELLARLNRSADRDAKQAEDGRMRNQAARDAAGNVESMRANVLDSIQVPSKN